MGLEALGADAEAFEFGEAEGGQIDWREAAPGELGLVYALEGVFGGGGGEDASFKGVGKGAPADDFLYLIRMRVSAHCVDRPSMGSDLADRMGAIESVFWNHIAIRPSG